MKKKSINRSTTKSPITALIAENKLLKAIHLAISISEERQMEYFGDTILLSMEYHNLEDAIRKGRVTLEMENILRNQLAYRLLKVIENFEWSKEENIQT